MLYVIAAATVYVLTYVTPAGDLVQRTYATMKDCDNARAAIWGASGRDDRVLARISCDPVTALPRRVN